MSCVNFFCSSSHFSLSGPSSPAPSIEAYAEDAAVFFLPFVFLATFFLAGDGVVVAASRDEGATTRRGAAACAFNGRAVEPGMLLRAAAPLDLFAFGPEREVWRRYSAFRFGESRTSALQDASQEIEGARADAAHV